MTYLRCPLCNIARLVCSMFSNSWISKRHAEVWCVHSTPNFSLPWQRRRQYRSSGSGFIIDAKRRVILTNAHCIEWHTQVKVQRRGSDTKHLATRPICLKTRIFGVFFPNKKSRMMINDASWEGGSTCWFLCNKICSNYLVPGTLWWFFLCFSVCQPINKPPTDTAPRGDVATLRRRWYL